MNKNRIECFGKIKMQNLFCGTRFLCSINVIILMQRSECIGLFSSRMKLNKMIKEQESKIIQLEEAEKKSGKKNCKFTGENRTV